MRGKEEQGCPLVEIVVEPAVLLWKNPLRYHQHSGQRATHARVRSSIHIVTTALPVHADMSNRAAYYEALLQVMLQLASHPPAARLFVRSHKQVVAYQPC